MWVFTMGKGPLPQAHMSKLKPSKTRTNLVSPKKQKHDQEELIKNESFYFGDDKTAPGWNEAPGKCEDGSENRKICLLNEFK